MNENDIETGNKEIRKTNEREIWLWNKSTSIYE